MRKLLETVFLAVGLVLFAISLALLTRPGASQGVKAMPEKYSVSFAAASGVMPLPRDISSAGTLDTLDPRLASTPSTKHSDEPVKKPAQKQELPKKDNGQEKNRDGPVDGNDLLQTAAKDPDKD